MVPDSTINHPVYLQPRQLQLPKNLPIEKLNPQLWHTSTYPFRTPVLVHIGHRHLLLCRQENCCDVTSLA